MRGARRAIAVIAASAVMTVALPSAGALYSSQGSGSGRARAATLPTPAPPTITGVGIVLLACVVQLSWTAPPAGEQYTIVRTIGTTTTTVFGPTSTAGSTTDSILLAIITGEPTYRIVATWAANPLWTVSSSAVPASGC
jgi:hypothetical protein